MDTLVYLASLKSMSQTLSQFFMVFSFVAKPHIIFLLLKRPKKRDSLTYIEIIWNEFIASSFDETCVSQNQLRKNSFINN